MNTDEASIYEAPEGQEDPTDKSALQKLFDNPWLLLALGVGVPFVSYTLWGWIELWLTKPAQLP